MLELIGQLYAIEAGLPGWYALTAQAGQSALAHWLGVRQQHLQHAALAAIEKPGIVTLPKSQG